MFNLFECGLLIFHLRLVLHVLEHILRLPRFQPVVFHIFQHSAFKHTLSFSDFCKTQFCLFQGGLERENVL